MGFYTELHCDNLECPHGALQEGPQGRTRRECSKQARKWGWKQDTKGRWLCAGCVADIQTIPLQTDEDER